MTKARFLKTCTRPDCNELHFAKGLCKKHYAEFRVQNNPICNADGCNNHQYAKGFCELHYKRLVKTGRIHTLERPTGCSVPGCTGRHRALGLCTKHYMQLHHQTFVNTKPKCTVEGCTNMQKTKGLCSKHYMRWYRNHTVELANGKMD